MAHAKNHDYHILNPSVWPFIGAVSGFAMLVGAVILAIALTDHLIHIILKGDHRITRDLADQNHRE